MTITPATILGLVVVYKRRGGLPAVEKDMEQVADELLTGVTLTQLNFEGGGGGGTVNRTPDEMMQILVAVKDRFEGNAAAQAVTGNFSCTPTRT